MVSCRKMEARIDHAGHFGLGGVPNWLIWLDVMRSAFVNVEDVLGIKVQQLCEEKMPTFTEAENLKCSWEGLYGIRCTTWRCRA